MSNYAIVIGIKDIFLNKNEKEYLKKYKPAGVILFKKEIFQVKHKFYLL